jgi:hypothetical protein
VHPIERLRYVARAGDVDAVLLAQEAADALGSLAHDARALVPACRRLIEFHPSCGPLWWVCARLLVASDVREAADLADRVLYDDPTAEELAAHFPAGATIVTEGGPIVVDAVSQRPDLTIRIVGSPSSIRAAIRRIDGSVTGYDPVEADDACAGATVVLLDALAAGPTGIVVDEGAAGLAEAAIRSSVDIWAVVGEGRLLPAPLFDALVRHVGARRLGESDDGELDDLVNDGVRHDRRHPLTHPTTVIPVALLDAVVGPEGAAVAARGLARPTCGSPTELLEPSRGM